MSWLKRMAICIASAGGLGVILAARIGVFASGELSDQWVVRPVSITADAQPSPATPNASSNSPGSDSFSRYLAPPQPTPFPSFNNQQLERQVRRFSAFVAQQGAPDILIIGSSRALQGVDPVVLKTALADRGYPNLKIFNFGINGATAQLEDWLLHRLIPPQYLPRLIIWADGSRAFNGGRVDHTFRNLAASPGYQALQTGKASPFPPAEPLSLSRIWQGLLHPTEDLNAKTLPTDSPIETLGFQVVTKRFSPETYFQRYPWVPGDYDADYNNFSLQGPQMRSLERIVRLSQERRIHLVVVNLPLTATYLDAPRRRYERRFRASLQQLARTKGFMFQDLATQPHLSHNQYFEDPSHINRDGAAAVAIALSQDLTRPLSQIFRYPPNNTGGASSQLSR
jgi:hypothetical protein